jgi:hypothetical protein
LRKYVHPDPEKRWEVGKSAGRPSLLTKEGNQGLISDALACLDRANDGSDLPGAIDLVQDISPHLSRTQAPQTFSRTIRPNHPIYSGVANNSASLEKLTNQLQLVNSLAVIARSSDTVIAKKKKTESFAERIVMTPMLGL